VNILTAMTENESVVKSKNDTERKAIALAWLFHLVGDIHQPLHTAQLFTVEYPQGDRGGNEICVRVTQAGQPMDLHRFWDGVITSSSNLTRLRNEATALRTRQEFQRSQLTEIASTNFESWAKESFEIATKIAYHNGGLIGARRDGNKDCTMVAAAPLLPAGYVKLSLLFCGCSGQRRDCPHGRHAVKCRHWQAQPELTLETGVTLCTPQGSTPTDT
jgi:hypothetical protein